jgi:hypothetical protein
LRRPRQLGCGTAPRSTRRCSIYLGVVVCLGTCRRNERRARVGEVCLGANQCSSVGHSWCLTPRRARLGTGVLPLRASKVTALLTHTHTRTHSHAHTRTHTHTHTHTHTPDFGTSNFNRISIDSSAEVAGRWSLERACAHTLTHVHTHTHTPAPLLSAKPPSASTPPVPYFPAHACVWAHWAALRTVHPSASVPPKDSPRRPTAASRVPACGTFSMGPESLLPASAPGPDSFSICAHLRQDGLGSPPSPPTAPRRKCHVAHLRRGWTRPVPTSAPGPPRLQQD